MIKITAMKKLILRSTQSLLQTLAFDGLSAEQSLLAAIVSQNPTTDRRVRQRAQSLLLLDGGATSAEVSSRTSISRRSLGSLIQRFSKGGLCAAILGVHASPQRRAWLTLSPSSAPRVQLQRQPSARRAPHSASRHAAPEAASASRQKPAPCCCHPAQPRKAAGNYPD